MSTSSRITEYLSALPPGEGDYVPLDITKMATDLGMDRNRVASHLSSMVSAGRLVWHKDESSPPRILGFSDLVVAGGNGRRKAKAQANTPDAPKPVRRLVTTPELDKISEAKSAMSEFVRQFPGLVDEARIEGAIQYDAEKAPIYATEGVALLERNRWLETRNRELSERVRTLERENGYLKIKQDAKLREGLVSAGVVHSED